MHVVALRALHVAAHPVAVRQACRIIAGSRHPLSRRSFHISTPISYRPRESPEITDNAREEGTGANGNVPTSYEAGVGEPVANDAAQQVETITPIQRVRGRINRRNRNRSKQPEGTPPVILPDWFWDNVKLFEDPRRSELLAVYYGEPESTSDPESPEDSEMLAHAANGIKECDLPSTTEAKYSIHVNVYREILASIRAGLSLRPAAGVSNNKNLTRPLLHLQCPKDGGASYMDSIVETVATKLQADLISIGPVDIAQLLGPYLDEDLAWTSSNVSLLGYESSRTAGKLEEYDKDTSYGPEDLEGAEGDEEMMSTSRGSRAGSAIAFTASNASDAQNKLSSILNSLTARPWLPGSRNRRPDMASPASPFVNLNDSFKPILRPSNNQWSDLKQVKLFETLISAVDIKRSLDTEGRNSENKENIIPRDLIIQIRDYKELSITSRNMGINLIQKLQTAVDRQWLSGQNIIIVGTTALEEGEFALATSEIQRLQSDIVDGEKRTIFVPPNRREAQDLAFECDEKLKVRVTNIRHIQDMIIKLAGNKSLFVDIEKNLDTSSAYSAGLEDAVWTFPRVQRLATTILGLEKNSEIIDGPVFTRAQLLLAESDKAKFAWGAAELKQEDAAVDNAIEEMNASSTSKFMTKEKLRQLRKSCTPHEKKLLNGVVIPSDIHTTFSHVHVPKETVDALKTLTSLSLVRPEAFTYGVLATDKIPGLLLYGPPGTGKTLLAKAVAKESGATVLEISGAEVNDMYVGEGEKNVRAIFSLAKKLSPCVVFIDEADAIFAARGEARRSSTHRELINQFLREWDGMKDMSAFIMVATNRPFDLDEAVLRRLPRRLLVDLPNEKDREAILNIHLKDEKVDDSVSLAKLAKDTPFYSGSDLKNLSVAAALTCIKEEYEMATKHKGDEPYVYPEKRILTKKHFDKAMEEISASINEDMSTLSAIRKFDEKYGDRKGRRKRSAAMGFGGTTEPERDSEAARVRKSRVEV